ncbi:hypothetical protein SELMODRAFT_85122, partial [Selaginella moellendorffii]
MQQLGLARSSGDQEPDPGGVAGGDGNSVAPPPPPPPAAPPKINVSQPGGAAPPGPPSLAQQDHQQKFDEEGGVDDGDRGGGGGGQRWLKEETSALIKIRNDMDRSFRDSPLKGPLWAEVSRKLAELGYQRSSKKCKEKFENVYKYYKKSKDGRAGRQDGKSYRFFADMEALFSGGGGGAAGGTAGGGGGSPSSNIDHHHHHHHPDGTAQHELVAVRGESGQHGGFDPASKRWPKPEVLALIKLRSSIEGKFQETGPKGPLWEEISSGMSCMGYSRSAKRCKEKWENINKYFRKTKDSSKKRPENSKTCPYFHQLDALYRKGVLG